MLARPRPDLVYFLGDASPLEKAATLARHLHRQGWRVQLGDGAVDPSDPRWQNLLGMMQWVNTHPLPDDADPSSDQVQARQLLLAALTKAQAVLQGSATGDTQASYNEAAARYQQYAAGQYTKEMPSALELWLAGLGLNLASPLAKIALFGALGLGLYLLLPALLASRRPSEA